MGRIESTLALSIGVIVAGLCLSGQSPRKPPLSEHPSKDAVRLMRLLQSIPRHAMAGNSGFDPETACVQLHSECSVVKISQGRL